MAQEIDEVVQVTISTDSVQPSRPGFGVPLVLTYHTRFVEQYRLYSSLFDMATDGFIAADEAYKKARAIFAQNPTVTQIVIGRLPAAPTFTSTLTMLSATEGQHIKFTIVAPATGVATTIDYTIPAAQTLTQVATAVELLVEAVAGIDSTSAVAVVTATPAVAGRRIVAYDFTNVDYEETTAAAGYDTELTSLQLANDNWYAVLIDSQSRPNIAAVASWVTTQKKLYFQDTNSSSELAGTTLSSDAGTGPALKAAGNDRAILLWHRNPEEAAAAAWVGKCLPSTPGSITWSLKSLIGPIPQGLTLTQRTALTAAGINHYTAVAGINVVRDGFVASGEFIDIIHGIDALQSDIQISTYALLAQSDKVPFTASGLDLVSNAILGALKRFEGTEEQPGLIAIGTSKVLMPALASISTADKAARRLTGVRFSGTLAGALHYVTIVGVLSV